MNWRHRLAVARCWLTGHAWIGPYHTGPLVLDRCARCGLVQLIGEMLPTPPKRATS